MAFINETNGEIHLKVLYIGAQSSGKTSNLQMLFYETQGILKDFEINSTIEQSQRNTFFDFLPLSYPQVAGRNCRVHLYTFPSHDLWPSVSINLLLGIDGIVNIIDSRMRCFDKNDNHIQVTRKLMNSLRIDFQVIPTVYQFNHTDSADSVSLSTLKASFTSNEDDFVEAIAYKGVGVLKTFQQITGKIVSKIV